jgi:crossover junction endodeoxyribonuclease RusA
VRFELMHLPDRDLSPNKRLHWRRLARAKQAAKREMMWIVLEGGKPRSPYERAHITITYVAKDDRRRDLDNMFASSKSYLDALVASGVIVDDSASNVTYTIRYEVHKGERENTIFEVDEK